LHICYFIPGFLFRFAPDTVFRVVLVQQPGAGFDEHTVRVAVDVGGHPELPGQDDRAFFAVVQQDGGAVAPVVGFAALGFPGAVVFLVFKSDLAEYVPVVREYLGLDNFYVFVCHC